MNINLKEIFSKANIKRLLKYALFMFLALVAQNMLFTQLRLFGVCPLVLPAVAVAVGMFEGATWGAVFSLIMGIFADMSFVEHTIFFALVLPALSFAAAFVSQFFINRRFFAFMGITLAALFITAVLQMLKTLAGDTWSGAMLSTIIVQTLWSLPFSAVAYFPPAKWIK
mgnify:CR=1 FL=1